MKRQHKINHGWQRPAAEITEQYQRQIDRAAEKAETRWSRAQKAVERAQAAAERAERRASRKPTRQAIAARDEARQLVTQRLAELRQIEELMRPSLSKQPAAVHRTGRQDRLEVGQYRKPRKNRRNP